MKKKEFKKIKACISQTFFVDRYAYEIENVYLSITNLDEFFNTFSTRKDYEERKRTPPFEILADLERQVLSDFFKEDDIDEVYTSPYSEDGDVIFDFEGFKYDEDSKTLVIEYFYSSSVS